MQSTQNTKTLILKYFIRSRLGARLICSQIYIIGTQNIYRYPDLSEVTSQRIIKAEKNKSKFKARHKRKIKMHSGQNQLD